MVFSSLAASCCGCAESPLNQPVQFSRATSEHKWRKVEDGSKQLVERHKRVKRWWLTNGAGQLFVTVRYGAKLIELEKGKAAISVSGKDKLAEVFEALIEAVRKGELDEQIKAVQSAAKASRKAA